MPIKAPLGADERPWHGTNQKPWERLDGETDHQFEIFCEYLQLEKRGTRTKDGKPRRFLKDLTDKRGIAVPYTNQISKALWWEERAEAYDKFLGLEPEIIATLSVRKEYAQRMRDLSVKLFEKGEKALNEMVIKRPEDIVSIIKLAQTCEEKAAKLEEPEKEEKRGELVDGIKQLISELTGQLAGSSDRSPRGTITATERTVSVGFGDSRPREEPVCEVPALAGTVCEGSPGADDSNSGSGSHGTGGSSQP
jgi:hypothetical protein